MIIVDTNVVSEPSRPAPNERVVRWLDNQDVSALFLTVTSFAELKVGVALLPEGRRKTTMELQLAALVGRLFGGRILDVTRQVAEAHADIAVAARKSGISLAFADAQIAAIARVHGFAVATRDVAPFEAAGVEVINPWESVE